MRGYTLVLSALLLSCSLDAFAQVVVTEPNGVNDRVVAGNDYATQVLGNAWEMNDQVDVALNETFEATSQTIAGGTYAVQGGLIGDTAFYSLHPGLNGTVNLSNGAAYPIPTGTYRSVSMKIRLTNPKGVSLPPGNPPQAVVYWYREGDANAFGNTFGKLVNLNQWQVLTFDLVNDYLSGLPWQSSAVMRGLRIDPVQHANLRTEIDWIRLTPGPAGTAANQRFLVTWTDSVNTSYTISAVDAGGMAFVLGSCGPCTQFNADLTALPPGNYTIRVARSGSTDDSNAPLSINTPPQFAFTSPSRAGEQSANFALTARSNPWGPLEAGDFRVMAQLEDVSFSNPVGTLTARPTGSDSGLVFESNDIPIDTALYRSLCFRLQIQGPRDVGGGSVARVFFGNDLANMTTSEDIIVDAGLNDYCIADLARMPLEPGGPSGWTGNVLYMRLDPHEFSVPPACSGTPADCRDIRLDNFVLSPWAQANPTYTLRWNTSDPDDGATSLTLRLDPDRIPANGNEFLVTTTSAADGAGQFDYTPGPGVPPGTYNVSVVADDGRNPVTQYATGPLVVGASQATAIAISDPGTDVTIPAATDYAGSVLGNRFDMNDAADVALARTFNFSGAAVAAGKFTGTTSTNDGAIVLVEPSQGRAAVPTSAFRRFTVKMRLTGAGTHFAQVLYFSSPDAKPSTVGFTSGKVVPAGSWQIVSFDLVTDEDVASGVSWTDVANMPILRFDPTTNASVGVEIDWITLTGAVPAGSDYTIRWSAQNLGTSTFDVVLLDADGAEFPVASGLSSATTSAVVNPSRLGPAAFRARVRAVPGPSAMSAGNIVVADQGGAVLFSDGFE
jgi:hypothetical protein